MELLASEHEPSLLVLLRHGTSLTNTLETTDGRFLKSADDQKLIAGMNDRDIPLVPQGFAEACTAGRELEEKFEHFDIVYRSNHRRSIQTEDSALSNMSYRPGADKRHQTWLTGERSNGYTFGMTQAQSKLYWPWLQEYWEREGDFYARPPGGESVADMITQRIRTFRELLRSETGGKQVLVVTHGRWITGIRIDLENLPTDGKLFPVHGLPNCGWVAYRPDEDDVLRLVDRKGGDTR